MFAFELLDHFLGLLPWEICLLHYFLLYAQLYIFFDGSGLALPCGALPVGAVNPVVTLVVLVFEQGVGGASVLFEL